MLKRYLFFSLAVLLLAAAFNASAVSCREAAAGATASASQCYDWASRNSLKCWYRMEVLAGGYCEDCPATPNCNIYNVPGTYVSTEKKQQMCQENKCGFDCEWDDTKGCTAKSPKSCADLCKPGTSECADDCAALSTAYPDKDVTGNSAGDASCSGKKCCCIKDKSTGTGTGTGAGEKKSVFDRIKDGVYQIIMTLYCLVLYVAAGIAALFIILTGLKYMSSDEESGRAESRRRLEYALIGLIVVALACPLVNIFFSGTDIGIDDGNGNKVACPGCPLLPGSGGIGPTPTTTTTSTTPPTPTAKRCQEDLSGVCCTAALDVGILPKINGATDCPDLCYSGCTRSGSPTRYGSCAAACLNAKDVSGTSLGYSGGQCKTSCDTAGGEVSVNTFDCQGRTCCCTKPAKTGKEGSYCEHSSDCTDPGLYCSGGANNPFDKNKCLAQKGETGKCPPKEEIDGQGTTLVCKMGIICWTVAGSGNPYECIKPLCGGPAWPGAVCCTAGETCVGKRTGTPHLPITDCPDTCCTSCTPAG